MHQKINSLLIVDGGRQIVDLALQGLKHGELVVEARELGLLSRLCWVVAHRCGFNYNRLDNGRPLIIDSALLKRRNSDDERLLLHVLAVGLLRRVVNELRHSGRNLVGLRRLICRLILLK